MTVDLWGTMSSPFLPLFPSPHNVSWSAILSQPWWVFPGIFGSQGFWYREIWKVVQGSAKSGVGIVASALGSQMYESSDITPIWDLVLSGAFGRLKDLVLAYHHATKPCLLLCQLFSSWSLHTYKLKGFDLHCLLLNTGELVTDRVTGQPQILGHKGQNSSFEFLMEGSLTE